MAHDKAFISKCDEISETRLAIDGLEIVSSDKDCSIRFKGELVFHASRKLENDQTMDPMIGESYMALRHYICGDWEQVFEALFQKTQEKIDETYLAQAQTHFGLTDERITMRYELDRLLSERKADLVNLNLIAKLHIVAEKLGTGEGEVEHLLHSGKLELEYNPIKENNLDVRWDGEHVFHSEQDLHSHHKKLTLTFDLISVTRYLPGAWEQEIDRHYHRVIDDADLEVLEDAKDRFGIDHTYPS